ncbi:putative phosphopantetheinyl transferase [Actinoplanes missouriensis 431]|uniref:Putative phosphopantetheinyl transferase n=1 Tax=Actinoplanes missouriensis (strain ATCC 14538 / DSM 43046 / CBS 188.64 / JCM 3121 / NBRC 102363 / NCIMB 12654 / NRRL B-3342 / UNCC 431) TaxID=512565 RepID=I0HFT9_ACTM4|nr:4'-phosphopantetheinyl transferase superfamily protein [Actinoplanes missouriensis]BAL91876.1 putative phosphopantetheinyl transferase [Actinoplanes missouriensis 431]
MLEKLLPSAACVAEAFSDDPSEPAFPGEEDLLATAVPGRRREFLTARRCAREALELLGHPPVAIRPGPRREPLWPDGVAGSITHCLGYRAAAVARRADVASIGIDAEPHAPLPPRVLPAVTTAGDRDRLAELGRAGPDVHWDRLLFSAKESIYKAWYPLTGRWLGFEDAELTIDPVERTFTGRILIDAPFDDMHGRFLIENGLVVTAVCHFG